MSLVFRRKTGQEIVFGGGETRIRILSVTKGNVEVAIDAPAELRIARGEEHDKLTKAMEKR